MWVLPPYGMTQMVASHANDESAAISRKGIRSDGKALALRKEKVHLLKIFCIASIFWYCFPFPILFFSCAAGMGCGGGSGWLKNMQHERFVSELD